MSNKSFGINIIRPLIGKYNKEKPKETTCTHYIQMNVKEAVTKYYDNLRNNLKQQENQKSKESDTLSVLPQVSEPTTSKPTSPAVVKSPKPKFRIK
jgi:hypothetical protein